MPDARIIILKQIHKEAGASKLGESALVLHSAAHQQQHQRHPQVSRARALAALGEQSCISASQPAPLNLNRKF